MNPGSWKRVLVCLACIGVILGCTLPWTAGGANTSATMVVETMAALQTDLAASQTAAVTPGAPPTLQSLPTFTPAPAATPTFTNPVVKTATLCWTGPGNAYPVVSGVKEGTAVELLGVGSKEGWFVIKNPTYNDRCWIQAKDLQLDPFFTTAGLQVYNPPPTPGPKITPGPSPTP
jgi:hypothetical protein